MIMSNEYQIEDITVEEARTYECCKGLTNEQIEELLNNIKVFTEIAYSAFANKQAEKEKQVKEENYEYEIAA